MGCVFNEFRTGKCQVFEEGIENPGCDEEGHCICDDDESPEDTCDQLQSDSDY